MVGFDVVPKGLEEGLDPGEEGTGVSLLGLVRRHATAAAIWMFVVWPFFCWLSQLKSTTVN